jgi:hypothetical protein
MVKKALLIGINYIGTEYELNGCINDVKNMKQFLIENCNFLESNIIILTDETKDNLPTEENIQRKIKLLVSNNISGDILVFHYSGHGSNIRDISGDETDKTDETIVPLNFETSNQIIDDWLFTNMISKINKNVNLYCFFDSCHSGTVIDLKYNYMSNCRPKVTKQNLKNSYDMTQWTDSYNYTIERSKEVIGNIYMLSGCKDNETSADAVINNKNQGAFTCCLLETFKNNCIVLPNGSNRFKNQTLKFRNILKEINCRLDLKSFVQNSQFSSSKKENFETTINL